MKPINPEEISALFDGELLPDRAEEVRRAIAEDEQLRRVYERLAGTDRALSSLAATCQFEPRVSLPSAAPALGFPVAAVAFGLLIVRILAKVLPFVPSVWLQALGTALLAAWLLYRFLPSLEADRWQVVRELGLSSPCGETHLASPL